MAITDVAEYAHLTDADLEALRGELEAIRRDIEDSRGEKDSSYIRRTIAFQRFLDVAARLVIAATRGKVGWALGPSALAVAKSIENMELGHNIGHGQWDWMNDPEIHSTTWGGTWWGCPHNGGTPTTTVITCSPTSSASTTTSGTAFCGSPGTNSGSPATCCSRCDICCWRLLLNGVSRCTICTPNKSAGGPTPKNPLTPEFCSAKSADRQRLPALPRARRAALAARPLRKRGRQPAAKPVGVRGNLLRPLRRRSREIHPRYPGGRDNAAVVSATNTGKRQLSRRPSDGVHERNPLLPDRTSPLPRPAQ